MDKFLIRGGNPLNGTVAVSGAKNATLELMLLTDKARMSFPFDVEVELP